MFKPLFFTGRNSHKVSKRKSDHDTDKLYPCLQTTLDNGEKFKLLFGYFGQPKIGGLKAGIEKGVTDQFLRATSEGHVPNDPDWTAKCLNIIWTDELSGQVYTRASVLLGD